MTVVSTIQQTPSLHFDGTTVTVNGESFPIGTIRSIAPKVSGLSATRKLLAIEVTTTDGQSRTFEQVHGSLSEVGAFARSQRETMEAISQAVHSPTGGEVGTVKVMGVRYEAYRKGDDVHWNPNRKAGKAPRWTPVVKAKVKATFEPA